LELTLIDVVELDHILKLHLVGFHVNIRAVVEEVEADSSFKGVCIYKDIDFFSINLTLDHFGILFEDVLLEKIVWHIWNKQIAKLNFIFICAISLRISLIEHKLVLARLD